MNMYSDRSWHGYWISAQTGEIAPYLRMSFSLRRKPVKAELLLCGLGLHELYVNGHKADDRVLVPGVSQCARHVYYVEYDVSSLLCAGRNAVAILLGNGSYHENSRNGKVPWFDQVKMLCDLIADGDCVLFSSEQWKYAPSPITYNQICSGENYDARNEIPGFSDADFDDSTWLPAERTRPPAGKIVRFNANPCRVIERIRPEKGRHISFRDAWIFDFGINISGWLRLNVQGPTGLTVKLEFSEEIDQVSGDIGTKTFQGERSKDLPVHVSKYTLRGAGKPETWEERFCYHGFRYVRISMPDRHLIPKMLEVEACVVHTDFASVGKFECSDAMLTRLQESTRRSFEGNFVGIPTDCPTREQNGWT
jgi:alpha-L-rhamnosidase